MKTVSFKKGIEVLGYTIERYTKGYNFRSAWARDSNGQLWYFHIEDLRDDDPNIYRRTAESVNDYIGGVNTQDVKDMLAGIGLKMVENRSGKDYNGN